MTPNTENTGEPVKTNWRKRLLFRLSAILLGVLVGLMVAEVALRLVGYSSPKPYMPDPVLGYGLIPGISGTYRREGRSHITINSDGFRDVEHQVEKPDGTYRIAIIGDSYVEAFQVERHESFANFAADGVRKCGVYDPKATEVLTFGVSGYSTGQQLLLLREKVLKYSPDLVVLLFTTNNDVTDNSRDFKKIAIPYFVDDGNGLTIDTSFTGDSKFIAEDSSPARAWKWLYNHIRVFQAIGEEHRSLTLRWKAWKAAKREQAINEQGAQTLTSEDIGIDNQIYREPVDEKWTNAWKITEKLLLKFRDEVIGAQAGFLLVTGSNGIQTLPKAEERRAYEKRIEVKDLFYPDKRLSDFSAANEIEVLTLAPILQRYAEQNDVTLHGFEGNIGYGHWNQLGHKLAGEEIGRRLCDRVLR